MLGLIGKYLQRSVVPSAIIGASRIRGPRTAAHRLARFFGLPTTLEVYFAFDDPYAALALPALLDLVKGKNALLRLYPLVQRGIVNDPSQHARALHSLTDANRIACRNGRPLSRNQPLEAQDCVFLAAWTASAGLSSDAPAFVADALNLLWRDSNGPVSPSMFESLYMSHLQRSSPPMDRVLLRTLHANGKRLHAKGHWESPTVRLGGEWFFAHERLAQIGRRLAELCA